MLKLLLVDDEKLEREAIIYLTEKNRPNIEIVGQASNGEEAINLARKLQPDIIFIDIKMPRLNGLEAIKEIKKRLSKVKIIITTAYDEFSFAQEAIKLGATDYLLKPVRPEEILNTLDKLTEEIEQEKEEAKEEQYYKEKLAMLLPYVQIGFLSDLLSGRITSESELRERASFINFQLLPAVVLVADIDHFTDLTSNQPELNRQLLKKKVFSIIKRAAKMFSSTMVAPIAGDRFVILFYPEEDNKILAKDRAVDLGEQIRHLVQKETSATLTIGVGHYYPQAIDTCLSYADALRAMNNRYFIGHNQVIHIQDVERYSKAPIPYSYRKERQFLEKVRIGNKEEAKKILAEIFIESFLPYSDSMELVRSQIIELLIVFSRTLAEVGGDTKVFSSFSYVEKLSSLNTIEDIRDWLLSLIEETIELNRQNNQALTSQVIAQAKKYLKENFNKEISLEEVSHHVHLSSYYFSRLFKKETGLNFVEYLTKLRIEEAKRLLRTSEETIVNIAGLVGYNEPNYFSRVFRRLEGITAKQYKSLNYNK